MAPSRNEKALVGRDGHIVVNPWNEVTRNRRTFLGSNRPRNRLLIQKLCNRRRKGQKKNCASAFARKTSGGRLAWLPLPCCFLAIQVLINWRLDWLDAPLRLRVMNYVKGGLLIFIMLTVANVIEVFLIGRIPNRVSRFNLKRIFRLVVVVAIVFVAISVLFVNWYAAFVSLGLISLILGFALQMPISSFIAWIYILARAPYRVGDRNSHRRCPWRCH